MNKYMKECIKFLFKNNIYFSTDNDCDRGIIDTIYDYIVELDKNKKNINLVHESNIKKINKNGPSLIFLMFKRIYNTPEFKQIMSKYNLNIENVLNNVKTFNIWLDNNIRIIPFEELFNILKKYDDELYNIIKNPIDDRKDLNEIIYDNPFISSDIVINSEENDLNYKIYRLENSTIHIYNIINNDEIDIAIIWLIIELIKKISGTTKGVNIYYFCSDIKKKMKKDDNIVLCPKNINSGMSEAGKKIVIWRREELYKVTIHELIHFYNIDFKATTTYDGCNFNCINCTDYLLESYTESFALIINTILFKYVKTKTGLDFDIHKLIDMEYSFTLYQIAKILILHGINNAYMIMKSNSNKIIDEKTSFLSYYIIKGNLIRNICEYFQFVNDSIVFGNNKEKINKFKKIIENMFENGKYLNDINNVINIISKNNIGSNKFIKKNMRMTCIEI